MDGDLPSIWEAVAQGKGRIEGPATLNQALMRVLPSCCRFFGGRDHFSGSLPLLVFVKNLSLLNPSLDPEYTGGGFTPWLTRQGSVKASTRGGADASVLAQQLDGRLASADSLRMDARVCLAVIPSANEALCDLGTFAFVALHLFSVGECNSSAVTKILRLIERLEEFHTKVQGMIPYPYLNTTLLYNVSRRWSQYLNMCVAASASEVVEAPGCSVPFSLKPIMFKLEGGHYIGPTPPVSLANLVSGKRSAGGGAPKSGGGSGSGSSGNKKLLPKMDTTGGPARVQARYDAHLTSLYLYDGKKLRSILAGSVLPTLHRDVFCKNWNLCRVC